MTSLPSSTAFTGSSVTEGGFKTAISDQRAYLAGLLGTDGTTATAISTLGALANIVEDTTPQLGGPLDTNGNAIQFSEGAAIASASSCDIWANDDGNTVHITGTTNIDDFATAPRAGAHMWVIFDSTPTVNDSATITVQGDANFTAKAGDVAWVYAETTTTFLFVPFGAVGPNSVTDNAILRADGTTGERFQGSGVTIDDSDNVNIPANSGVFLTEGTAPATGANLGALYTKDTGGQPELFYREESSGDEVQLTSAGSVNAGGDVTGPGSSTDNAVARFDSTTGKLLQNSGVTIDDSDNVNIPANSGVFLTEGTAPATGANLGALYTKDTGGQPELFYREESSGDEVQLTSAGSVNAGGGGTAILSRTALSATSSIEVSLDNSTYDHYQIRLQVIPSTTMEIQFRTSTDGGSTFDSGGSDYKLAGVGVQSGSSTVSGQVNNAASRINLTQGVQTDTSPESYVIDINNPSAADECQISWSRTSSTSGNAQMFRFSGYRAAAADVDAIQILTSTGTLTGVLTVIGIKNS